MADPYVGEIRPWAFNWAQHGWALCDGTQVQIQQNAALYSLLGIAFGGNGSTAFNLPDLRGRTPVGIGLASGTTAPTYSQGNVAGVETVTLNITTVPSHSHAVVAVAQAATQTIPTGNMFSNSVSTISGSPTNFSIYNPPANWSADAALNASSVGNSGGGTGHNNMQPFAVVNFAICTSGYYPARP